MNQRQRTATEEILSELCLLPRTLRELSDAYPKTKYRQCKWKILGVLDALDFIVSTRKKQTITRKGIRELRKLIEQYAGLRSAYPKPPHNSIFEEIKLSHNYSKNGLHQNTALSFLAEIEDQLGKLDLVVHNEKEFDAAMEKLVRRIEYASGAETLFLKNTFMEEARKIMKENSKPSNANEYYVDREKLFSFFIRTNKIPKKTKAKMNTVDFKWFLSDWVVRKLRQRDKRITKTNVKSAITQCLRDYDKNYEMCRFMDSRFGIETDLMKAVKLAEIPYEESLFAKHSLKENLIKFAEEIQGLSGSKETR